MHTPHLPALALAFAIFISSAFAGQNFKPMELPKTGLTEEQISAKADCLVWFTAEYVGNSDGLSADTILRWHREQFRKMRPASREWAKALGNSTQPQTVDWVLRMFMGEDAKLIRYAYQKCFVDNEEPGDLGLD